MSSLHGEDETVSFPFSKLNEKWKCQKNAPEKALQNFISFNRKSLEFLKVTAWVDIKDNELNLFLRTSKYAGSVPLLSPLDGKPYEDLCIGSRFGRDKHSDGEEHFDSEIAELLPVLNEKLQPEYDDTLPQLTSSLLNPPLFFECCNFIDKWLEVERSGWQKFNCVERVEHMPNSGTQWAKYALQCSNPCNVFNYPNRTNRLERLHVEFRQLLSVLFLCINEINGHNTPIRSKFAYSEKIAHLKAKYNECLTVPVQENFLVHSSDPVCVKQAKNIANTILKNKRTQKRAWRIDYAIFFERYVQYLIGKVANTCNAKVFYNQHYPVSGWRPVWALRYIEPDIVLQKDEFQYVIDAKYKPHIFNLNKKGGSLKETAREDMHQILAYCSFNSMNTKKAVLVYPFSAFVSRKLTISSPLSHTNVELFLIGIPLAKHLIGNSVEELTKVLVFDN